MRWWTALRPALLAERRALFLVVVQLLPSALIHMRKPFGEALSAIPGAFLMGVVAWRSRSIVYAILLHWAIGAMTDLFCWLRLAGGA